MLSIFTIFDLTQILILRFCYEPYTVLFVMSYRHVEAK